MRKLLITVLLIAISFSLKAQFNLGVSKVITPQYVITVKVDTTILNKGDKSCYHNFIYKQVNSLSMSCAVNHYNGICPDRLTNEFRICNKCFRHENLKQVFIKEDGYEDLIKKIK